MKKFFFSVLLACSSLMGFATDTDNVTAKLSGTTLNIGLENATTYCAFQMDITLPEGTTAEAVEAVANRLSQEGSDSEVGGKKFIVAYNTLTGNVLRVIAYNLANAEITGGTGDILKVTLGGTAVSKPEDITVSNILFVNKETLEEVALSNASGENGVLLGDVNRSGDVNLNDLVCLIEILQKGENDPSCAVYDKVAADVNQSGDINLNDLVILISKL